MKETKRKQHQSEKSPAIFSLAWLIIRIKALAELKEILDSVKPQGEG